MKKIHLKVYIILLCLLSSFSLAYVQTWNTIKCTSHSMYPTINCTNEVDINFTQDVRLNDIVLFRNPDNLTVYHGLHIEEYYVLHRIIKVNRTHYVTKGDNNTIDDFEGMGWAVKKENIKGKVIKIW